jgi:predicted ATPase
MIVGLSIKNFKGIRELNRLRLGSFHVLVGPNGAGKTTLLEAIDLVRDCLDRGPAGAVESRHVAEFRDLTWQRMGGVIEVELWLDLAHVLAPLKDHLLRYRLAIRQDEINGVCVEEETLFRYERKREIPGRAFEFSGKPVGKDRLLGKTLKGTDFYSREKGSYLDSFNFGADKLTLALTPPDEDRYPTANAVRRFLMKGLRYVQLDSAAMRLPCPATRSSELELDGTNLARVVGRLLGSNGTSRTRWPPAGSVGSRWADHLRYAMPALDSIGWSRREADNAEYVQLRYRDGLEVPSWALSDGTLRMLALTVSAFLPPEPGLQMIEEPENGVHPKALEVILRSLSSVPVGQQMLLATHSPYVVQLCGLDPLLCVKRGAHGTQVIPGSDHPAIKRWDGIPDLGVVFAAGLLE